MQAGFELCAARLCSASCCCRKESAAHKGCWGGTELCVLSRDTVVVTATGQEQAGCNVSQGFTLPGVVNSE